MSQAPKPEGASTIFVLGLLSLLFCGLLLGPVAWVLGNSYMRECQERDVEPDVIAVAGRIMGIIAVILWGLGLMIIVIALMAMILIAMLSAQAGGIPAGM